MLNLFYLVIILGQYFGHLKNDETNFREDAVWHACLLDQYGNAHPFRK